MEKTIGDKIKELLEVRDITPAELSRRSHISTGLLADYINNRRTGMTVATLQRLAKALGIHPAYFIEDDTLGPADIMPHLTDEERSFVLSKDNLPWLKLSKEAFEKGLTPEKIRQIINIMSE